jgi:hypothetical protein
MTDTAETHASRSFLDAAGANPCTGCSAPCCRMLLIPHPTPTNFMDLDYIRYMLGFGRVSMVLNRDGTWQVRVDDVCDFLDQQTNLCTVHATARQPKTCEFFNPHRCWYKRNFTVDDAPQLIRIDQTVFERMLELVRCDGDGQITELPTWETIQAIARDTRKTTTNGATAIELTQRPTPAKAAQA